MKNRILQLIAFETGIDLRESKSVNKEIAKKIYMFAQVANTTPKKVLENLEKQETNNSVLAAIRAFGKKISEKNQLNAAYKKARSKKLAEFKFNGKTYSTGLVEAGINVDLSDLKENVDVQQAEVVMAVRAIADNIQSQIEKIGRTMNEDIPAIVKQMGVEMGSDVSAQFQVQMDGVLDQLMASLKSAKTGIDQAATSISDGEQGMGMDMDSEFDDFGGPEMPPELGDADMGASDDMGVDGEMPNAEEMPMNEPTDNINTPMGRKEVEK